MVFYKWIDVCTHSSNVRRSECPEGVRYVRLSRMEIKTVNSNCERYLYSTVSFVISYCDLVRTGLFRARFCVVSRPRPDGERIVDVVLG